MKLVFYPGFMLMKLFFYLMKFYFSLLTSKINNI